VVDSPIQQGSLAGGSGLAQGGTWQRPVGRAGGKACVHHAGASTDGYVASQGAERRAPVCRQLQLTQAWPARRPGAATARRRAMCRQRRRRACRVEVKMRKLQDARRVWSDDQPAALQTVEFGAWKSMSEGRRAELFPWHGVGRPIGTRAACRATAKHQRPGAQRRTEAVDAG
jgi:hypothetical protein